MKTGPVLTIPCGKAQELAKLIEDHPGNDEELVNLAKHLRTFTKGFALICSADEDMVLWPGGPDLRDFQLGGGKNQVEVVLGDRIYSNEGGRR